MSNPVWSESDALSLASFKKLVNNVDKASRIEQEPVYNRDMLVYFVHLYAPPPNPVDVTMDSWGFQSKDAALAAVAHAKEILNKAA